MADVVYFVIGPYPARITVQQCSTLGYFVHFHPSVVYEISPGVPPQGTPSALEHAQQVELPCATFQMTPFPPSGDWTATWIQEFRNKLASLAD